MTVADNTSRNQYTATPSQALFAYTFEIVDKDDIVVLINGIPLSEGTDYTVTGVGSDTGGNIVLTSGTTGGNIVTIYRDMPYARTQNYTNSGDFLASEVNSDFDNLWLASEQTNRSFEQSVRKPITDSDSISMELPQASSRANKLLGFDATGAVSTSLVTGDAQTIAGIAADIETLAHIQDGTVATDAITNVNTIRTDVTAVSGVASDVTAVAGNTANINTVATDLTGADDIGAVAGSITNVNTVAGSIANVNSVAGNATNINTVATDLAGADDIGTVAGSISSVNTVAPDINHVVTVSGDLAGADNIGTVATNISNVNAVGGISSDVTTVAGISTEVTAVSSNSTNINTVGTNITNVNNVGSNIANVNTVAGLETEINAVVADAADIGVVGANITSVNTVSSNINSVNAVYNNMADVNNAAANATAAAASAADANTSAGAAATSANAASTSASNASSSESAALTSANNASQSAATASLSASAAATSATNASSSAANAATSESNADDSETAAAISASNASSSASTASNNAIAAASSATSASNSASQAASSASAAATSATNSETAADTWNSYYSTYLGASATAPSYDLLGQQLQNGALYFNTTDNTMYVYNGSIWIAAESTINIVSVPTQLAADLTTNGNDIIFGDGDKAKFGAGNDLEIYHDPLTLGTIVNHTATSGVLILNSDGSGVNIYSNDATALMAQFVAGGASKLFFNASQKLSTTNTGIDVNGSITSDGLTVDGNIQLDGNIQGETGRNTQVNAGEGTGDKLDLRAGDDVRIYVNGKTTHKLGASFENNGDVSFYEDTGTTAKFFWDASAERLGLGTSSPAYPLTVYGSNPNSEIVASFGSSNDAGEYTAIGLSGFIAGNDATKAGIALKRVGTFGTGELHFLNNNTLNDSDMTLSDSKMMIDTSGNVGIGTSSPSRLLHVRDTSSQTVAIFDGGANGAGEIGFRANGTSGDTYVTIGAVANDMVLSAGASERMRVDSSGRVGIGTVSPAYRLGVATTATNIANFDTTGTTAGLITFSDANTSASNTVRLGSIGNNLAFYTNTAGAGTERMRIDASGNVGIGTTSPAAKINTKGNDALLLQTDANNNYGFHVTVAHGANMAKIGALDSADGSKDGSTITFGDFGRNIEFSTNKGASLSEAMRIDSSGKLLVGKTSSSIPTVGIEARPDGAITATRAGNTVGFFNRTTSDGAIVDFRKDNTSVGSIGTNSGSLFIGSGDTGLNFRGDLDAIYPWGPTGGARPNVIDLGYSTVPFKNLYLSGGVVFGATGGNVSSKTLDDYEEGTFTPTLSGSTTAGTPTYTVQNGFYTKIGNLVTVHLRLSVSAISGAAGNIRIGGLPFTSTNYATGTALTSGLNWPASTNQLTSYVDGTGTNLRIFRSGDDASWGDVAIVDEFQDYLITVSYRTAA